VAEAMIHKLIYDDKGGEEDVEGEIV